MATGFSVMDALNKNSKAGVDESPRARFRTKDISIFKMYRNKLNFYDLAILRNWQETSSGMVSNRILRLYLSRMSRVNIESSQVRDGGLHSSTLSSRDIKILRLRPAN